MSRLCLQNNQDDHRMLYQGFVRENMEGIAAIFG